jgi:two-component system, chemotaxis family, sensor kinase CheA
MLRRLPIRIKLILLAGVPVLGALILATIISRDAQRRAQSAAALGSIEDLAVLSAHMSKLVQDLQFERSELGLRLGLKTPEAADLGSRFADTDAASQGLSSFLSTRRAATLPPRLTRDLGAAREQLARLPDERRAALAGLHDFSTYSELYGSTCHSLISATAALAQLSDDGELMRAISALVSTMEIKERSSQEQALLSHVFALGEFPPGTYKQLVTLTTQETDYLQVLEVNASDAVTRRFHGIWSGAEQGRTAELRKVALDAVEDHFDVDPLEWHRLQGRKIERLRSLEIELNEAVKGAALAKVDAAQRAVRLSYGLGAGVIVVSALLAGWIAAGISRSVRNLSRAAEQVRTEKDFKVRALKNSEDELGRLTDAFNEMLAGIETRDDELAQHRGNLERSVTQRTAELSQRNAAMRLVLDNVEQGLATIEPSGKLSGERSRAFEAWFGNGGDDLAERLAQGDEALRDWLGLGWMQVADGLLPTEVAIDQLPRRIYVNARHYQLGYRAIMVAEELAGVLLVVTDVTSEMERMTRDAEQREVISSFEHLMRDRAGTLEFFEECAGLVARVSSPQPPDGQDLLRALHTLKGNASTFGVSSVADAAHRLETELISGDRLPEPAEVAELTRAWQLFAERMGRLLGTKTEPVIEVALSEFETLVNAAKSNAPDAQLSGLLAKLRLERARVRLERIADQARSLAQRLGKSSLRVEVDAQGDVRFDRQRWSGFWAAFVHAVRNALDHGIESEAERKAAGKPAYGRLTLSLRADAKSITLELSDDGRGVDFERVRAKARVQGLPHESNEQLIEALFSQGFSTSGQTTELSGRGIGLSALREAARSQGGAVSIESKPGLGTTLRVRFSVTSAS